MPGESGIKSNKHFFTKWCLTARYSLERGLWWPLVDLSEILGEKKTAATATRLFSKFQAVLIFSDFVCRLTALTPVQHKLDRYLTFHPHAHTFCGLLN